MNKYDIAANLAIEKKDYWAGRMSAKEQRAIFGAYIFGKKRLSINCDNQGTVEVRWKVAFGQDGHTVMVSFERAADLSNRLNSGELRYVGW